MSFWGFPIYVSFCGFPGEEDSFDYLRKLPLLVLNVLQPSSPCPVLARTTSSSVGSFLPRCNVLSAYVKGEMHLL